MVNVQLRIVGPNLIHIISCYKKRLPALSSACLPSQQWFSQLRKNKQQTSKQKEEII
jgi:hypothetical protein